MHSGIEKSWYWTLSSKTTRSTMGTPLRLMSFYVYLPKVHPVLLTSSSLSDLVSSLPIFYLSIFASHPRRIQLFLKKATITRLVFYCLTSHPASSWCPTRLHSAGTSPPSATHICVSSHTYHYRESCPLRWKTRRGTLHRKISRCVPCRRAHGTHAPCQSVCLRLLLCW